MARHRPVRVSSRVTDLVPHIAARCRVPQGIKTIVARAGQERRLPAKWQRLYNERLAS